MKPGHGKLTFRIGFALVKAQTRSRDACPSSLTPLSANTGRGHFSPRCGAEPFFARNMLQAVINEGGSPFPGCPPYYCRCISDSELIDALLEKPAGTLGSPGVQISSPSQCSRGTSQSRPYPARPLKMMESAAQYAYDWGAAPSELAQRSPVTGLAGCRTCFPMKGPSRGILLSDYANASSNQREAPRVVVWLCPAAHSKTPMKQGGHFTSLSVGFHTPTARLLSTARGQTTPGIPFSFAVKLSRLARRAERLGDAAETRELLPSPQSGVSPARRTSFAAELPDEGGIWFSPFRLLSTVLARLDARCGPHMAKRELALARRGSNTTMTQRCAAKVALVVSATGKGCRVGNPAWTVGPVVRHIEGTGHGRLRLYPIRNPRQCLPGRGLVFLSQRPDAQPFLPPGHQQSPAGSVRTPTTGGNL